MTAILEASAEEEQVRDMGSSGDDSGSFTEWVALVEGPSKAEFLGCSAKQRGETVLVETAMGQKTADAMSAPASRLPTSSGLLLSVFVQHQR